MNGPPVPAALYVNNNARVGPTPAGSAPSSGPPLPSAAIPMEIYRNLNNQAMPVAQSGSSASINAGAAANVRTSNDAAGSSAPRPAGSAGAPPSYSSSGANSEQTPSSRGLVIDVHQIRVGVRKFLPMPNSSVLFKDEGVLFTLKGKIQFVMTSLDFTKKWEGLCVCEVGYSLVVICGATFAQIQNPEEVP